MMTGRLISRPGWDELMARVQPNDTIVVIWLDRFSRNFDEGVRIQADLTKRNIGIVAIKGGIDTTDNSAAAKYFRRMMMANRAYQVDSTNERIKVGQDHAKAEGRPPERPPALTADQVNEYKRMFAENLSVSRVARIMKFLVEHSQQGSHRWNFSASRNEMTGQYQPFATDRALRLIRRQQVTRL